MKVTTKTLYHDNEILIKYNKKDGTFFYRLGERYGRVFICNKKITKSQTLFLASILKVIYDRCYDHGSCAGYGQGKIAMQNEIKKVLGIKGE